MNSRLVGFYQANGFLFTPGCVFSLIQMHFWGICVFLTYFLLFLCLKIRCVWPGCVLVFLFMLCFFFLLSFPSILSSILCLKIRSVWPACVLVFLFMQWALCAHLSSETVRKSLALRLPGQPQCNLQCDKKFRILDFVALNLPWCNLQWAEQSHLLGFVALKLLYWKYTMLK